MNDMSFEERLLERAAASIDYPATPQLRPRVLAAIARPAEPRFAPGRRLVLAAATAAAVVVAVVLGVPASRTAVADFFHIRGSKVERLPTPRPGETPTPFPTPVALQFIATPVARADAAAAVKFDPLLPAGQGDPLQTYLIPYGDPPVVVLQYERFDLWESRQGGFFGKGVPQELIINQPHIKGLEALWIHGGNHIVQFFDASGTLVEGSARTVDRSTMIWNDGTTFFRLETDLPEPGAIAILESLP